MVRIICLECELQHRAGLSEVPCEPPPQELLASHRPQELSPFYPQCGRARRRNRPGILLRQITLWPSVSRRVSTVD